MCWFPKKAPPAFEWSTARIFYRFWAPESCCTRQWRRAFTPWNKCEQINWAVLGRGACYEDQPEPHRDGKEAVGGHRKEGRHCPSCPAWPLPNNTVRFSLPSSGSCSPHPTPSILSAHPTAKPQTPHSESYRVVLVVDMHAEIAKSPINTLLPWK